MYTEPLYGCDVTSVLCKISTHEPIQDYHRKHSYDNSMPRKNFKEVDPLVNITDNINTTATSDTVPIFAIPTSLARHRRNN